MRSSRRTPVQVLVAAIIIVASVAVGMVLVSGDSGVGFRLRSSTMVPTELHYASDLECPESGGPSPIDYLSGGALAQRLAVYDGEMIAVRLFVSPYAERLPDSVAFRAEWPTDVVVDDAVVCAFVVDADGAKAATLDWTQSGPAAAEFTMRSLDATETAMVEIWLEADEPVPGATMSTDLAVDDARDEIVLDTVGGGVSIDRRSGSAAAVSLTSNVDEVGAAEGVELLATVANNSETQRSFDVALALEASLDGVTFESTGDGSDCGGSGPFECRIGELAPGEVVEIPVAMNVPAASPVNVSCGDQGRAIGVCVSAEATSVVSSRRPIASQVSWVLLRRVGSSTGDLTITGDPPTVARRTGEAATARLLVTSDVEGDVSNLHVVGSDCVAVERTDVEGDGDGFLSPGEIWAFECTLGVDAPSQFRVDLAGTDTSAGRRVSGSYSGVIENVAPALEFSYESNGGNGTVVTVTNIGVGSLHDLSVRLPGCMSYGPVSSDQLLEGQRLEVVCSDGEIATSGVAAYGVDIGGRPFVIRSE